MAKHVPSPAATRSNVKNPNNSSYAADRANRISQGHATVPPPPPPSTGNVQPKE